MAIWILKAVVQKTISFLPASQRINYFFQKHITKGVNLSDGWFEDKLIHCSEHFSAFKKYSKVSENFKVLELGTGWFPVVPIGLFLCGAHEVLSYDLNSLLRDENVKATVEKFKTYHRSDNLKKFLPLINDDRLNQLLSSEEKTAKEIFEKFRIKAIVGDASRTNILSHSIDLIVSNNVFEHIYPAILTNILNEFKRITKPGGVMCHFVDMSDHFAHLDKKISIYNFLKFSEGKWKMIDNSIQPMNRLRIYDYRKIYSDLKIPVTEEKSREGNVLELKQIKLDKKFSTYSPEQTAISHSLVISAM